MSVDPSTSKTGFAAVHSISETMELGLFNPYVRGGNIVVNGIVASPHSEWILDNVVPSSLRGYLPHIYEAILTPIYYIYLAVGPAIAEWLAEDLGLSQENNGATGYLALVGLPVIVASLLLGSSRKLLRLL